ncbi:MAG TPA: A/G-specific adenine glycosylase [Xanthobacteraceae bacterium]
MTVAGNRARQKKSAQLSKPDDTRLPQGPDPAALLAWYDRHRRRLPWRADDGEAVDPYRVWLSEIMLQQTTAGTVAPYYQRFLARWPTLEVLAAASLDEVLRAWAGLGYYARARNLHACARAVMDCHGGRFPDNEAALARLPGVGPYTAGAIAAIAFGRPAAAVDGNVERVVARLYAVEQQLPTAKPMIRRLARALTPAERAGDFAQALMDLGASVCTPRAPACARCPWNDACAAYARGEAESFPRKAAKRRGRLRRGVAFVAVRADGSLLVRTRPASGLLGGMTEVPTSPWTAKFDEERALEDAPLPACWRRAPDAVTHMFTHFPLELLVYVAKAPAGTAAPAGMRFVALSDLDGEPLPVLMRKILARADFERVMGARRDRATASGNPSGW